MHFAAIGLAAGMQIIAFTWISMQLRVYEPAGPFTAAL